MALPSSGKMSLSMIAAEFGGSPPHKLSEYYRGGAYVPNITANNNIPTSGPIAFSDFYGATNYVAMSNASLTRSSSTKEATSTGNTTLTSDAVSATVSGGQAPYSYSWERVSGTALTVNSQGSSGTTFARTAGGVSTTSVYRCKITDGTGAVAYTGNITINFTHFKLNAAAIIDDTSVGFAPDYVDATVAVYRNGTATGGGYFVTPASSTVGDKFEVRFDSSSTYTLTGSSLATVYQVNTGRGVTITAHQSQAYKPTISKSAAVRVRIRRIGGSYLIDKTVTISATCQGDDGGGPL